MYPVRSYSKFQVFERCIPITILKSLLPAFIPYINRTLIIYPMPWQAKSSNNFLFSFLRFFLPRTDYRLNLAHPLTRVSKESSRVMVIRFVWTNFSSWIWEIETFYIYFKEWRGILKGKVNIPMLYCWYCAIIETLYIQIEIVFSLFLFFESFKLSHFHTFETFVLFISRGNWKHIQKYKVANFHSSSSCTPLYLAIIPRSSLYVFTIRI